MTLAERLVLWNRWYDGVSEEWRFQFVVWSLLTHLIHRIAGIRWWT